MLNKYSTTIRPNDPSDHIATITGLYISNHVHLYYGLAS